MRVMVVVVVVRACVRERERGGGGSAVSTVNDVMVRSGGWEHGE